MSRMTNQIINEHCVAAYPQSLVGETFQLRWFQMVSKQAATYQVERSVGEWKRQCIRHHATSSRQQVRVSTVQISNFDLNPLTRELLSSNSRDFPKSRSDIQY